MSQRALAGRRITPAGLSMIESGKRRPSAEILSYLADRLGTTEDYLLTGRDPGIETKLRLDIEQARLAVHQGRASDVIPALEKIIETARRSDLVETEAVAREVIGASLQKTGRYEEAIEAYDAAAALLSGAPVEHQTKARCGRARCLFLLGDVHFAVHVLEVLLTELRRQAAPDPAALAQVYSALVGPYFKSGFPEKARRAVDEAQRLGPRVGDPEVVGCMNINLGGVYLGDGRVEDALKVLARAEQCFTQLEWSEEIATTHVARAIGLIEKQEWQQARTHLVAALATFTDISDPISTATALNQLGRVERMLGDIDEAERCLQAALDIVSDGNLNERGLAQRELGLCALERGDTVRARELLHSAVDSFRTASNAIQLGVTYKVIGDAAVTLGEERSSVDFYRDGLEATTAVAPGA